VKPGRIAAAVAASLLFVFGLVSGCTLPRNGALSQHCTLAADCDDDNPCTTESCGADGLCAFEVIDADPPQVSGDCRVAHCSGGFVRQEPAEDPELDDNECTDEECRDDFGTNYVPAPDSEKRKCTLPEGEGHCKGGVCLKECDVDAQCHDGENCTDDACDTATGYCVHQPYDGVESPQQEMGDCHVGICQAGEEILAIDDADVPDDGEDCTVDTCSQGLPEHANLGAGDACATSDNPLAHVCDGSGSCVECVGPSDCTWLAPDDACHARYCQGGVCVAVEEPQGTPLPPAQQVVGDCHEQRCDGMGQSSDVIDDTDVPADGHECTLDTCTAGVPQNTAVQQGTACGQGGTLVCDVDGDCVGCNAPTDCGGTDGECGSRTCNGQVCGMTYAAANTPLQMQTAGDCQTMVCNGAGVPIAIAAADPLIDGNACTADLCNNGSPSNPPRPVNFACNQNGGSFCNGNGQCVQCNGDLQCPAGGPCQSPLCSANSCQLVNVAQDTPAPGSLQTDGDCHTVVCDGMGGVNPVAQVEDADLPFDVNQCTDDVCQSGTPSHPPKPASTPCNQNGGVVCNGAPAPACVECATSAQCLPTEGCDTVSWTCKLVNGQGCGVPIDCLSNLCVDTVCCATSCVGVCRGCNVMGFQGACTNFAAGSDPQNECAGTDVCNGSGVCRCLDGAKNGAETDVDCGGGSCVDCGPGQACLVAGDCTSDVCTGGICQAATCGDGVVNGGEACDVANPATPCCAASCAGPASNGTVCGADPDGPNGCGAPPRCNGAGTGAASCIAQNQPNGTVCNDSVFCNGNDTCAAGACTAHAGNPCPGPDGDGNCSETCDEVADDCAAADLDGSACTDGLFCNGNDTCSGGSCAIHVGDPCPGVDGDADCAESCDESADVCTAFDPLSSPCDDGIYCTATDACDAAGVCVGSGNPCPGHDVGPSCDDSCDETTMSCIAPDAATTACDEIPGGTTGVCTGLATEPNCGGDN
jgi:hypothetical protein